MNDDLVPREPALDELLPGSDSARRMGCRCSVLANAAAREAIVVEPLVDPTCPLHALL